jgi:hypothetical protein
MLGVTRIVLELVILRHCPCPPTLTTRAEKLSRIVEVSLFKREHSQIPADAWSCPTFPPPITSELFDTDSESDAAQSQQMPGALSSPPAPQAPVPVRYVCVRTRPQRGLAGVFALPRPAFDALKRQRDPQGDRNIPPRRRRLPTSSMQAPSPPSRNSSIELLAFHLGRVVIDA